MEASISALTERVRQAEDRIRSNDDFRHELRASQASQATDIAVLHTEVNNLSGDISDMQGQMKWVMRGLWLAAATFLTFTIALATLIVSLSHG